MYPYRYATEKPSEYDRNKTAKKLRNIYDALVWLDRYGWYMDMDMDECETVGQPNGPGWAMPPSQWQYLLQLHTFVFVAFRYPLTTAQNQNRCYSL